MFSHASAPLPVADGQTDAVVVASLRRQLATPLAGPAAVLALGDARVDAHLPGGGLPVGQLHEIGADGIEAQTGAVVGGFAACLAGGLARRDSAARRQVILWIAPCCDLYAPGLLQYGVDPGQVIVVRTGGDAETLGAMETALRSGAAAAVLGEVGRLTTLAARRLQLACLRQGSTGLVLRRWPHGRKPAPPDGNAAATRWRVHPAPRSGDRTTTTGPPCWQVELLHARGGRPGRWIMQRSQMEDAHAPPTHPLSVVAVLGDHAAAPRQDTQQRRYAG